jgi:hypothetical protein
MRKLTLSAIRANRTTILTFFFMITSILIRKFKATSLIHYRATSIQTSFVFTVIITILAETKVMTLIVAGYYLRLERNA